MSVFIKVSDWHTFVLLAIINSSCIDSIRDDVNVHINAFKEAVKSKGSLTCYMAQCMTFGPPRVGKTCLFHNLLDEDLPGTPTTNTTAGSGSESTDVLAESKMVQIELKMDDARGSTVPIVVEEDGKWSPINTMKDEIAIYMKSLNHQTKLDMSKSSKPLTPEFTDDLQSDSSDAKVEPADTSSLDDAVIDAVTRHVREGNVDLSRLQLLLSKSITIFFTDTGGQPEFQEVLPVLATGPTIFILVFDLHQPLDSVYKVLYESSSKEYKVYDSCFSVRDALMQCLSSISSFHCGQSRDFSKNELMKCSAPPTKVMSIATHRDLVSKEIYAKVDNDLKESIKKATVIDGANIMEPFTKDHLVIPIDNYDRKDGSKVRKVIERVIRRGKSLYKVELPANWLCLQLNLRQRDSSTIAFSGCLKIAAKLDISREELKSCLWYLHYKTGTIRYYDQVKELEDTVILRPKILFTAVTKLIMSTFTIDDVEPSIQEKFNTLGLFKVAEVRDIFDEHKAELEISFDQFTALLQHLNILVPAHDGKHDYFLPCALVHAPVSQPTNSLHSLALLFNGGFVPKGAYSNLVGSLSKRRWSITCANCKPQLFRNKVVFSFDHAKWESRN